MRSRVLGAVVLLAVLFPEIGKAQAFAVAESAPRVTAANAGWQLRGDPLFHAGAFYYPVGPTVFFDPNVMVRTGVYEGIPLYADATLEPYSLVYVPIGGNVMRPYERRRAGDLAGTVGSRMPSFPIERDVDVSSRTAATGLQYPPSAGGEPEALPETATAVATGGTVVRPGQATQATNKPIASSQMTPTHIESIPGPAANRGVWLEYQGVRWHTAGTAVLFVADRFIRVGDYYGFPVYRQRDDKAERIYVPAVAGGPLTPYQRP